MALLTLKVIEEQCLLISKTPVFKETDEESKDDKPKIRYESTKKVEANPKRGSPRLPKVVLSSERASSESGVT